MKNHKMMKRFFAILLSTATMFTMSGTTIWADNLPGFGGNQNNSYTHGSSTTITEDMLKTEEAIPDTYDVNADTQGSAKKNDYEKLFDISTIQDVNITIHENNWNYLLQNAIDKPTVLTDTITIGDETIQYAGLKTKGNLTLSSVWNSDSDRFSFTANFGKYIKKKAGYSDNQNFYGLNKVAFNDIYGDATLMKEYLSYQLMTEMGVDTPYYCLVNLSINGEFYGVYMMVESIDSALSQRTIGEKSDYFVKPEASGGDLVYDSALDTYLVDGEFQFDTTDYPTDASNPLYKYNGLWENDEDTFNDIKDLLPTIFKWMKTLNDLSNESDCNSEAYQTALSSFTDPDKLLRYFAVNTFLVNMDSYQSSKMQNYGLYINEEGFMNIYPWDYNFSFGGFGVGNAQAMVNFSISNPVLDVSLSSRPLLNVLLQNDDYKALYEKYLNDCCIIASKGGTTSDGVAYSENHFESVLETYKQTLQTTYAEDPTAFYTVDQYLTATENFEKLIALRTTAVLQQLAGDNSIVTTDINLNTLGNSVGGGGGNMQPGDQFGQNTTLTDDATGITVSGMFPQDATLSITKITEGDQFTSAANAIGSSAGLSLYKIAVNMPNIGGNGDQGNQPTPPDGATGTQPTPPDGATGNLPAAPDGATGNLPTPPDGTTGNQPTLPDGTTGNQPTLPDGTNGNLPTVPDGNFNPGNTMGSNVKYTVTFPVSSNNQYAAYLVTDGNATELTGTLSTENNTYSVTTDNLGMIALVQKSDAHQNNASTIQAADTSASSDSSTTDGTVQTGDQNRFWFIGILATASTGALVLAKRKRKNSNHL